MSEITIPTPRGINLAGTFVNPVDAKDRAVIFSHSFLADRHSGEHFDRLAAAYRAAGFATLEFDYSGCGTSDNDVITLKHQIEDLHSASSWLAEQGFTRQLLHAHSFGTLPALKACPEPVETMVLTSLVAGPLTIPWDLILDSSQLDDLEKLGHAQIPDDTCPAREHFVISRQTLLDLSLNKTEDLFANVQVPLLIIHDMDDEVRGLIELTQEAFPLLRDGSHVEITRDYSFGLGEGAEFLRSLSVEWANRLIPTR
ncbi:hypothetical protein HMPREF0044_0085 [Gleimia coleocanis DSM 15436]|uniref:AB hydrolase-1 domain-containing protein n=1 Tax=Gleimia coleocanis DSM 15436 TaxID=525245 RepID=C0VY45_9ACTO|nr:alpha/beta fold hydrolase [Gleimia coleocanis]EEH64348.1 hypothetical protein HMPREF0044_0085 [Gleimia coleocanis DSM 15436]